MTQKPTMEEFLAKVDSLKEKAGVDLSTAEDLSLAVMNLISLEEHFFFTAEKTKKDEYFDVANEVRSLRKDLLKELMPTHEGETWCISKHLLSATMRLIEVGNKLHSEGEKENARAMYAKAYKVYSLFWALKVNLISAHTIAQTAAHTTKLEDLIAKLADCCDE